MLLTLLRFKVLLVDREAFRPRSTFVQPLLASSVSYRPVGSTQRLDAHGRQGCRLWV